MSMVINTNASALNAIQNLEKNEAKLSSSMEKLSSGLKINGAADDSANLAIATRMAAQIGSLIQASANAQAGVSLINIADGALILLQNRLLLCVLLLYKRQTALLHPLIELLLIQMQNLI
jgi:flagellin-like hook-associated protein FlgL